MVLGKDVVGSDGRSVGAVVDVGVHSLRHVKFLVVEREARKYERMDVDMIEKISRQAVVLKPISS